MPRGPNPQQPPSSSPNRLPLPAKIPNLLINLIMSCSAFDKFSPVFGIPTLSRSAEICPPGKGWGFWHNLCKMQIRHLSGRSLRTTGEIFVYSHKIRSGPKRLSGKSFLSRSPDLPIRREKATATLRQGMGGRDFGSDLIIDGLQVSRQGAISPEISLRSACRTASTACIQK